MKIDFVEFRLVTRVGRLCTNVIWVIYKHNPRLTASLLKKKKKTIHIRKAVLYLEILKTAFLENVKMPLYE